MTERFLIETRPDEFWPGDTIVLRDRVDESWARIVPSLGCNLVSFGAMVSGRTVEAFLQPGDEEPAQAPGHYGAPVLFPFPSRLRDGRARFGGRQIAVDRAPGQQHAIHGLVRQQPWRVDHLAASADGAVARFSVESDADILRQFPFPFRLTLTFRLSGRSLRVTIEGVNLGDAPMPTGFGWHPYFRLPLVPGGDRRAASMRVPARSLWKLDSTLVPTGEVVAVPPERDFRTRRALGAIHLDDVFTDLERQGDESSCEFADPTTGAVLRVSAGATFREWVVYAPPSRPTICFEPYTCPTDAFNLSEGGRDVGVIVLKPGERWTDWMELSLTDSAR